MFTGIVEETGVVLRAQHGEQATRLAIECRTVLEGAQVGDSLAVSGVCLTVVAFGPRHFEADAVPETLRRSNLGKVRVGTRVNLERAIRPGRFFGGHFVQGHVDTTATVVGVDPDGAARTLRFRLDSEFMRFVVPKGYVAVDGVSLTVVDTFDDGFSVTLVPHTQSTVTLGDAAPGYLANLELDVLGKYVERVVDARLGDLEARLRELETRAQEP